MSSFEQPAGPRAIEIEFAPKGTDRLKRIVDVYRLGSPYHDGVFFVRNAALGLRIQHLANRHSSSASVAHRPARPSALQAESALDDTHVPAGGRGSRSCRSMANRSPC